MMFQNPDEQIIFPTVEEELALGLEVTGLARRLARERTREWLQARGLGQWAERAITSLSQGQRQHVCWLARIISGPRLLLLNEPFASLDLPGQALLDQEIQEASQQIIGHSKNECRPPSRMGSTRIASASRTRCA